MKEERLKKKNPFPDDENGEIIESEGGFECPICGVTWSVGTVRDKNDKRFIRYLITLKDGTEIRKEYPSD